MAFQPRTFETIRDDIIAYLRTFTDITDFEVGSTIRTLIEAFALEDDEQYFQMVQLLDAFKISTASGQDLDERAADYDVVRLQAGPASGKIIIQDGTLVKSSLNFSVAAGATSLTLASTSSFPTAGFPYTVRIGEGTPSVEDVSVSANNTSTGVLTVTACAYAHASGVRVSYVDGGSDRTIASGLSVQVPATGDSPAINFVTKQAGTLVNGNYESTPIAVLAQLPGKQGNVGSGKITRFASSPPFDGATVTNASATSGGRDRESDADLRDRALAQKGNGTFVALKEAALGVSDPVTGQRVTTANVHEDFDADEVIVYVDDGTGFTPDQQTLARTTLSSASLVGANLLVVVDASDYPREGFLIVSPESGAQIELLQYTNVDYATNTITLSGTAAKAHDAGDEVVLVDVVEDSAEAGANFFQTASFPIVRDSVRVWSNKSGSFVLLIEGTDYHLDRASGQLQLVGTGLTTGNKLVTTYAYYTGLIATVQKIIDGDVRDPVNFPGVKAAGVHVVVETPIIRRVTVRVSITAASGFSEEELVANVQEAIESYISALGIGADVIRAEIIERAMSVNGVYNVVVNTPSTDIIVLENELPVPFSAGGDSLVTVT